ncbi:transcriptional regulator [candidate division KSB3 bacterium]|uniref:Transcriptional regulator n=1 Tax=candidate division KSB3 bacterium TaxID=2044937 RepID=A0A2G6E2L9_9BACT|nr:MAG: transcriptional regulator [candidate division KSB3 bacterium]PIE29287.1 MAG: transcriptional regulator [candidate division KSB3 bacterium]
MSNTSLLTGAAQIQAPLDPGFIPAVLANRRYRDAVKRADFSTSLAVAVEREDGLTVRRDLEILAPASAHDSDTQLIIERHIKFLLWANGGWKMYLSGPEQFCTAIAQAYAAGGAREFDAKLMQRVYGRPVEVAIVSPEEMPETNTASAKIGGYLDGCRIGFDLGASDFKLASVVDGDVVFSTEIRWDPVPQSDPQYHVSRLAEGLKLAASKMPRVDAIGGSSAGIYINNEPKVASLFRSIPEAKFSEVIRPMFHNLQQEWNVPLVVINDGDVTALAGALSLKKNAMLGIAMGSSEAIGYLNPQGSIMGYLNELAFAPVDFNQEAVEEEWSGDRGVGALYFSQQAVNKLAPAAGFSFPDEMLLPERLKIVQAKADEGDPQAARIFETIGVYLGYTLPHYAEYYDFDHVLILGRVTSGRGGEIVLDTAKAVLKQEFSELDNTMSIHVPDEQSRRVGQAVAAASLPEI